MGLVAKARFTDRAHLSNLRLPSLTKNYVVAKLCFDRCRCHFIDLGREQHGKKQEHSVFMIRSRSDTLAEATMWNLIKIHAEATMRSLIKKVYMR